MKRLPHALSCLALLALLAGCSNTKPNDPANDQPGTEFTNPEVLTVLGDIEAAGDFGDFSYGSPYDEAIDHVGLLFEMNPSAGRHKSPWRRASINCHWEFVWDEASMSWIFSYLKMASDTSLFLVDTLQLTHSDHFVQWPSQDSLTLITSRGKALFYTNQDTTRAAHNIALALASPGSDTLTVDATGSLDRWKRRVRPGGLRDCSGQLSLDITVDNVTFDLSATDSTGKHCPWSGSIVHHGAVNIGCSGDTTVVINGDWTVSEVFFPDHVEITVSNSNGLSETIITTCGVVNEEPADTLTFADTAEVFDDLVGEGLFETSRAAFVITGSLLYRIPGAPPSNPFAGDSSDFAVDSSAYAYTGGWHRFTFWVADSSSNPDSGWSQSFSIVGVDSIRIFDQGIPVPIVTQSVDSAWSRLHGSVDLFKGADDDSEGDSVAIRIAHRFRLTGNPYAAVNPTVTVNALSLDSLSLLHWNPELTAPCSLYYAAAGDVSGLTVDLAAIANDSVEYCPPSGTLHALVTLHVNCPPTYNGLSVTLDGVWDARLTFSGEGQTVRYQLNDSFVEWPRTCGGSEPVMTGRSSLADLF